VVGASGYYIYLKNGNAWKRIKTISSGKTLTYTKKSLTCGTSYTYTVRAYYKSGNTIVKSSYNAKGLTAKAVTAAPTLKSVIKKAKGLQVNWKKVTGASGYYVYRKVKGSTQWTRIAKISSAGVTSYCDKTVKSSKTYVYTVRSYRTVKKVIIKGNYNKNGISL
jgi:hypothetical protein